MAREASKWDFRMTFTRCKRSNVTSSIARRKTLLKVFFEIRRIRNRSAKISWKLLQPKNGHFSNVQINSFKTGLPFGYYTLHRCFDNKILHQSVGSQVNMFEMFEFFECQPTKGDFPNLLSNRWWIVTAKHKPHEPVKVASNGKEFQLETLLQFDIFEKSDNCSNIEVRASKSSAPAESVKWIPFYWCHKRLYFCHTKSRSSTRGATGFSNCWMNLTT